MPDAPELRSIVDDAERAAAAGDYASAESLLRQALLLQEAQLGPGHTDLANTLNNLGIVCENTGKAADAESCYRRAYTIAVSSLAPDDPLVLTSGQNLREFCAAQGKPLDLPAPPARPAPPAAVQPVVRQAPPTSEARRASARVEQARTSRFGPAAIVSTLVAVGIVGGLLVSSAPFGERETPEAPKDPPAAAAPVVESAPPPPPEPIESPAPAETAVREAPLAEPDPPAPRSSAGEMRLVEARLCRTLSPSTWRCTPVTSPAEPGVFFFYTRLTSPREGTVLHRWYFNDRLLRTVRLRVGANQGAGFRTYSRNTIIAERAGDWRIEVQTEGGETIREERFAVRER
jgi:hypothetical protein